MSRNANDVAAAIAAATRAPSAVPRGGYSRQNPPTFDQLSQFNPNLPGVLEVIWQPFYDWQSYPAAGLLAQSYFQNPQGQGTTVQPGATGAKTLGDTNMVLAGQFPAPTALFVTAVQVVFIPSVAVSVSSGAALRAIANINDVVGVGNSGVVQLVIGSKPYFNDAPLGKCPPNFGFDLAGAIALTGTAPSQSDFGYGRSKGRYCEITPFFIPQSQNFVVNTTWAALVTVTSTTARLGVILDGFYYRQSQ